MCYIINGIQNNENHFDPTLNHVCNCKYSFSRHFYSKNINCFLTKYNLYAEGLHKFNEKFYYANNKIYIENKFLPNNFI